MLQQLKDIGLMKKDDIMKHNLVTEACFEDGSNYSESRLRFFIDWDPASFNRRDEYCGKLPLQSIIILNGNKNKQIWKR